MSLKNNRKYQRNIQLMDLLEAKKNGFNSPHLYQLSKKSEKKQNGIYAFVPPSHAERKQFEGRANRQTFPRKQMKLATISALAGFMVGIGGMTFPPPFNNG